MGYWLESQYNELTNLIATVGKYEPVGVVTSSRDLAVCQERLKHFKGIEFYEHEHCNIWLRDVGPCFVKAACSSGAFGKRSAISWDWHGYGPCDGKYGQGMHSKGRKLFYEGFYGDLWEDACELDCAVANQLAKGVGVDDTHEIKLPFEGGAIVTDGEGTGVVIAEMLPRMGANRAPPTAVKRRLLEATGLDKILWLPHGLSELGNSHADMICAFIGPQQLLLVVGDDPKFKENVEALRGQTDALGRAIQIIPVPFKAPSLMEMVNKITYSFSGKWYPLEDRSYTNLIFVEGAVLMPSFGDAATDGEALQIVQAAVAKARNIGSREVVQVPWQEISRLGGGLRCLSIPVPL